MPHPTPAASLYLRLSHEAGAEQTGLASQEADLRALAERLGAPVVAVRRDDGFSGALRHRPGLRAWIEDARSGRAGLLLAWSLDRVTRGGVAALAEVLDLVTPETGPPLARLLTVRDALDSASPAFRLQAVVMAEIARAEREAIRSRIRRGQAQRAAEGRWNGGTIAYGLQAVPNPEGAGKVLVPEPVEAAALQEAARRVLAGETLPRVARWLSAHGPAPRRAEVWTRQVLAQTLQGEGARLALTPATRRALAERLRGRSKGTGEGVRRRPTRLLSGVLLCSSCGRPLSLDVRHAAGRPPTTIYRCPRSLGRGSCRAPVTATAIPVEEVVSRLWLAGWGLFPEVVAVREGDAVSDRLATVEAEVERLREALAQAPRSERAALLAALDDAEDEAERLAAVPVSTLSTIRETGRAYCDAWLAGTVEDRRDLLLATTGPLTVGRGRPGVHGFDVERLLGPSAALLLDPHAHDDAAEAV